MRDIKDLQKKIKLKFNNLGLLEQATAHRSYLNEAAGKEIKEGQAFLRCFAEEA